MPKTREEILQDFFDKTGAEKPTGAEKNTLRPIYEAITNINLVANGQKRCRKIDNDSEKSKISPALTAMLTANGFNMKQNANDVEHTTNTGFGEELVPDQILSADIIDFTPQFGAFLSMLPGFHGSNMGKKETVPIIGDEGFMIGNTEWTTGAGTIAQGNSKQKTGEIDIEQAPFLKSIDISKRLLNYSVVDIEAWIKTKIARSEARTIESIIINGDSESGGTGNVNSDDQEPATTFAAVGGALYHATMIDHGVREIAINGSNLTVNAGTADLTDLIALMNILGDLASNPEACMWLFNRRTYNKYLTLQAFYDASQRGQVSTVAGNAITNLFGSDLTIARDYPLAEADGKKSGVTLANNTLGGYSYIYKPAIQWGYGQAFELDVVKIPGLGISVIATNEVGITIVQKKAGLTDSSVASAINVTV